MARIAGVNIPTNKRVIIALPYIHGIGRKTAVDIATKLGIDQSLPNPEYTKANYQKYLKRYLRCVKGVDDNVKRLVDFLRAAGELDNTIIVYTGDQGFFLMSEAASIDKQMHTLDYDRALGDLLELDDTVRATIDKLKELDILEDTLVLVSADHGHGFE